MLRAISATMRSFGVRRPHASGIVQIGDHDQARARRNIAFDFARDRVGNLLRIFAGSAGSLPLDIAQRKRWLRRKALRSELRRPARAVRPWPGDWPSRFLALARCFPREHRISRKVFRAMAHSRSRRARLFGNSRCADEDRRAAARASHWRQDCNEPWNAAWPIQYSQNEFRVVADSLLTYIESEPRRRFARQRKRK